MGKIAHYDYLGRLLVGVARKDIEVHSKYCRKRIGTEKYQLQKKDAQGNFKDLATGIEEYVMGVLAKDVEVCTGVPADLPSIVCDDTTEVQPDTQEPAKVTEPIKTAPSASEVTASVETQPEELPGQVIDWDDWGIDEDSENKAAEQMNTSVVQAVLKRLPAEYGMDQRVLSRYLSVCQCRNRKCASYHKHIINTRLTDTMGQPIYILDYEAELGDTVNNTLRRARLISSLAEAIKYLKDDGKVCNCTELPQPIQWAESPKEYLWDWTLPINSIHKKSLDHVLKDRISRIPAEYHKYSLEVLTRHVRNGLMAGKEQADRDFSYALPMYSAKYDSIGMLLPWHINTSKDELPEAVFILYKDWQGYHLGTVATPQMVHEDIRIFLNPENTWLRGANKV